MRSIPDSTIVQQGIQCIISCILQTDIAEERRLAFVRALSKVTLDKFMGPAKTDEATTFRAMRMYWIACALKNFECFSSDAQIHLLNPDHSIKLLDDLIESFDLTSSLMLSYPLTSNRSFKDIIWISVGVFLHTLDAGAWRLVQKRLLSQFLKVRQDETGVLILDIFELIASKGTFLS